MCAHIPFKENCTAHSRWDWATLPCSTFPACHAQPHNASTGHSDTEAGQRWTIMHASNSEPDSILTALLNATHFKINNDLQCCQRPGALLISQDWPAARDSYLRLLPETLFSCSPETQINCSFFSALHSHFLRLLSSQLPPKFSPVCNDTGWPPQRMNPNIYTMNSCWWRCVRVGSSTATNGPLWQGCW
jgi:hypothetical protein